MSEVKRYEPGVWEVPIERGYIGRLQKLTMFPAPEGEWVKAEDYAAMAEHAAMVEMKVAEQDDKIVRYEAELARVYLIADQYRTGRCCTYCNRIIDGRPAETAGLPVNEGPQL